MEPKSVWRKLHTIEQSERELIGEAKEERQIMSGSFIKNKYQIRRKRQRPMDSPGIGKFFLLFCTVPDPTKKHFFRPFLSSFRY